MLNIKMIGNRIAEARKKKNISQTQLAGFLFISPQAVGKWERGESSPDIITFNRLSEILDVDLNYFSENFQSSDDESASKMPINSTSDMEQTTQEAANLSGAGERQVQINLTAVNLQGSDFAGVILHKGKFKASPLSGANFAGADLTSSTFEASDARKVNFDGANVTDCTFSISDLADASFSKSVLVRTNFNKSSLVGTKFTDVELTDVKLTMIDLRKTIFENCIFNGVDFKYSDLRGMRFDGHIFIGVQFDKSALNDVSFTGATLRNVSFRLPFSVTNKSYRAFKTVCFDGAMMDKLTYAGLKGLWIVDLSKVTVI
ncbi:pentapeptide repeat-containing protein [Mucilaginibacter sp. BJC16-A38]|uniref:pentapeptide repeat-containing protein n=1 Tax=Mucilaginibacter phenanthrenivorans TaxID=1234842 RepID=UPI002157A031|nr:pentapeptide repeat-containing protein [Mucilaginibacter phenanthrenivorans]MCR8557240.1 pentapeptide repeat-containing protein [Mucilaginibacter phenanthrenivorans]